MNEKLIKRGKNLLIVVGFVLAAWVIIFLVMRSGSNEQKGSAREQAVVGVNFALVERRDLIEMRVFSGSLIAEKQYDAAAKIGGQIQEIAVNLGDCIRQGDLIARLDSEEYEQQVAQARAELDVAHASLAEARSSLVAADRAYQRAITLRAQKVASASELETAETERLARQAGVHLAQAQIKQREAALRTADVRLSYTTISADWQAGTDDACRYVAKRHVDAGNTIAANAPVVTLVDLSLLKAVINVAERDYALIKTGQLANISVDSIADKIFPGTVARMAPVFEETSRQARVEIAVPNPDGLLQGGMFARVYIEFGRAEQALAVPSTAIIQRSGVYGAFVVEDSKARFVEVKTGIEHEGWSQVTGLEEGQKVVTIGHHLLSDGAPVSTSAEEEVLSRQARE
ncbi:MAG: efflux RND transporter periplasmic adaptor subunit [Desulfoarculaceae bacterium]|nr:efflux RND transporter periplasmic adaptor subunit [Desulfoarculaceae bacterium]